MGIRTGLGWVVFWTLAAGGGLSAQTLSNQSLNAKYYFRHLSLGTDGAGNLTDPRSLLGAITFDGTGHFSYTGQQVVGAAGATSQTGSGAYSVDPAGFVSLDSPLRSGAKINARLGSSVLVGSTTEYTDNTYDLFAAVLAPAGGVGALLPGPYWAVTLEFPGASRANVRNTFFGLSSTAAGQFANITVNGHAANLAGGSPTTQQVTGATYTMAADGVGTGTFGAASTAQLLSGSRTLYLSADGNMILGGSTATGAHDFLIAVKAQPSATNASWNQVNSWAAGLRVDPVASAALGYAGATAARTAGPAPNPGNLIWTKRFKQLGQGAYDVTARNSYVINVDGSGTADLGTVGLGTGGKAFVGSVINTSDPGYEIFFGSKMTDVSGTGVFLNPQGIVNAASYAPAGNPIAPGEYIALFGSGLSNGTPPAAKPPYPQSLNNVSVYINGRQAPLYFVSPGQINALVPYATQGPTATIVIQNGSATSNTVTVPVAATAPGVFSTDATGTGFGAVLHANYAAVTAANPAIPGETVMVFLAGLGTVTPAVGDGLIPGANTANATPITAYIAGQQITPAYSGLAPGYPGLYQMNIMVPILAVSGVSVPLAINTPNAFHDQVVLPIL